MTTAPFLIFDLDGTLSDPAEGVWRSINYALLQFGYPEISAEDTGRYIGPPIDESFLSITGTVREAHVLELVDKFRERYIEHGYAENSLYPGIEGALVELASRGHRLAVCTSKRVDMAEKILVMFGIRDCFDFVSGGDVGIAKTRQLAAFLARERVGSDATMIGDRSQDVRAALVNGLRPVGVLWGHGSEHELRAAGATVLLHDPGQLARLGRVDTD